LKQESYQISANDIASLFELFEIIWGPKWTVYTEKNWQETLNEWFKTLKNFEKHIISLAYESSKEVEDFPPSLAKFREHCIKARNSIKQEIKKEDEVNSLQREEEKKEYIKRREESYQKWVVKQTESDIAAVKLSFGFAKDYPIPSGIFMRAYYAKMIGWKKP